MLYSDGERLYSSGAASQAVCFAERESPHNHRPAARFVAGCVQKQHLDACRIARPNQASRSNRGLLVDVQSVSRQPLHPVNPALSILPCRQSQCVQRHRCWSQKSKVSILWLWTSESFIQTSTPYGPCVKRSPSKPVKTFNAQRKRARPHAALRRRPLSTGSGLDLPSTVPVCFRHQPKPRETQAEPSLG